jgi:hypothetical protein
LQLLRPEQRDEQIDEQPDGQDPGEPEQRDHGITPWSGPGSQPIEEPDHRDRDREQCGGQNQVEHVEHRSLLQERSVATAREINNA